MIKVQNNIPTREAIPAFLQGLAPESLSNLSWTDPALGVSNCKWLPEVDQSPALGEFERYGDETLTLGDGVVSVTRAVVAWSQAEIDAIKAEAAKRVKSEIVDATQKRLDDFAQTRNYDGILSLCTYATSPNPKFKAEGQCGVEARDSTWAKLYEILEKVTNGTLPMPNGFDDVKTKLPVLEWPNAANP